MSRPHFAYPVPAGFVDERAVFPFDQRNTPGSAFVGGNTIYNQILQLSQDAEFRWRGISWEYPTSAGFLLGKVCVRIYRPDGHGMSDDFIPLLNLAQGSYVLQPWSGVTPPSGPTLTAPFAGGMGVAWANEIVCPPSSVIRMDLLILGFSQTGVGRLMARGVKRRPIGDCETSYR